MAPERRGDECRLHPFSWLFVLVAQLRGVALPAIVLLLFGRGEWWEFLAIVGAVLLALYSLVYSFGFRYRISNDELVVREGIFDRTERHIPFARIQNIARRSNLLHRLFGVTELRLESGGGTKPEAVMKVLRVSDAEALVALLRARRTRSMVDVDVEQAATPAKEVLLHLPLSELVRFGLISNRGMVVVAGAFAAFWQFSPEQPKSVLRVPINWIAQMFGEVSAHHFGLLTVVGGGALLLFLAFAALRLLSVVLAILGHYGFTLERDMLEHQRQADARHHQAFDQRLLIGLDDLLRFDAIVMEKLADHPAMRADLGCEDPRQLRERSPVGANDPVAPVGRGNDAVVHVGQLQTTQLRIVEFAEIEARIQDTLANELQRFAADLVAELDLQQGMLAQQSGHQRPDADELWIRYGSDLESPRDLATQPPRDVA